MNLRYVFYFLASILYVSTALNSYGFDDEYFNIDIVERYGISAFLFTQSTDVHPPLSYLINSLLYDLFGSWVAVRVISAILICFALFYVGESMVKKYGNRAATLTFLLLATSPAILLWGTSIRWYAYFLPVLLWLCITPDKEDVRYWAKLAFGLIILGYIGYISFLISPAIFLLYWLESNMRFNLKLKYAAASLVFVAIIYAPQLLVFLTVHLPNGGSQMGSLFSSLAGVFITQFSNQGVFPISIAGLVGAIGFTVAMIIALISQPISITRKDSKLIPYAIFIVLAVISGISAKFRNLVIATPFQAIWLGSVKIKPQLKRYWIIGLCLVFIGNFGGLSNVYFHKNTTKNSWNTPIYELLIHLEKEVSACDGSVVYFSHDPVISYHLKSAYINSYGSTFSSSTELQDSYKCGFIITTFQGSFPNEIYSEMMFAIEELVYSNKSIHYLNEDPFYEFKHTLDSRYLRYGVTITKFEDIENATVMESWFN